MVLVIDNYDSFTHNLARYFVELGQEVCVLKNDQVSISQLHELNFTHLVISPGPCTPNESGICLDAIREFAGKKPILGVCLGHQAIAQVYGASIVRAKHIRHGKTSDLKVVTSQTRLFADCPKSFVVTRYHSLLVDASNLAKEFVVSALCNTDGDDEIMAIEHSRLRLYGLQFHPESLLTEYGHRVLNNFLQKG